MEDEVVNLFRGLDLDGDGLIDRGELGSVLERLAPERWNRTSLDQLFGAMDNDDSGGIDYAEFVGWLFNSVGVDDIAHLSSKAAKLRLSGRAEQAVSAAAMAAACAMQARAGSPFARDLFLTQGGTSGAPSPDASCMPSPSGSRFPSPSNTRTSRFSSPSGTRGRRSRRSSPSATQSSWLGVKASEAAETIRGARDEQAGYFAFRQLSREIKLRRQVALAALALRPGAHLVAVLEAVAELLPTDADVLTFAQEAAEARLKHLREQKQSPPDWNPDSSIQGLGLAVFLKLPLEVRCDKGVVLEALKDSSCTRGPQPIYDLLPEGLRADPEVIAGGRKMAEKVLLNMSGEFLAPRRQRMLRELPEELRDSLPLAVAALNGMGAKGPAAMLSFLPPHLTTHPEVILASQATAKDHIRELADKRAEAADPKEAAKHDATPFFCGCLPPTIRCSASLTAAALSATSRGPAGILFAVPDVLRRDEEVLEGARVAAKMVLLAGAENEFGPGPVFLGFPKELKADEETRELVVDAIRACIARLMAEDDDYQMDAIAREMIPEFREETRLIVDAAIEEMERAAKELRLPVEQRQPDGDDAPVSQ